MHGFGGRDIATAWEIRCRRFIFEQSFQHSVWPPRHSEHPGKDYHRRGSSLYADRFDALLAGRNRFAFRVAVNGG